MTGSLTFGVADGRVARVEPSLAGTAIAHVLDASGLVVTPGLIATTASELRVLLSLRPEPSIK